MTPHCARSRLSSRCAMTRRGHCSMAKLNLTHPLGNSAPIILPELVVEARPYAQIFEVRGDSSAIALHQPGLLPDQPNRSRDYPAWRALSLRPGGWLLIDMSEGAAVGHPFASS